nr:MAG TPA: Chromatin remodeling complex ATPase [Caudoviricetes sp.]
MKELDEKLNIIVCQKSKVDDWIEHVKIYYGEYEVLKYNNQDLSNISTKTVLVINYDLIWRRPQFTKITDFTLILDESSYIKNDQATRTKFIRKLKFKNVILLSGTPVAGKYEELYSQLKLLGYKKNKSVYFSTYIVTTKFKIGGVPIQKGVGYKCVDRLKRKLRELGAVFMKTEDVFKLPAQVHNIEKVANTTYYKKFKKDRLLITNELELVGDTTLNRLLYCRQLASQYNQNKLDKLKSLLEGTENRVIIFYNFDKELELIKSVCKKLNKPISIVNGKCRDLSNYEKFNNSITLIQYQAGSMGLNLQKANVIVYFSLTMSSELFEQSKKRTHRIGQQQTCFYYYLLTEGSVDEEIYNTLLERKDYTDRLFIESEI